MSLKWTGDLTDDCHAKTDDGYLAHVELMDSGKGDEDGEGDGRVIVSLQLGQESWHAMVNIGSEVVFHWGEADIHPLTGPSARKLCEMVIDADRHRRQASERAKTSKAHEDLQRDFGQLLQEKTDMANELFNALGDDAMHGSTNGEGVAQWGRLIDSVRVGIGNWKDRTLNTEEELARLKGELSQAFGVTDHHKKVDVPLWRYLVDLVNDLVRDNELHYKQLQATLAAQSKEEESGHEEIVEIDEHGGVTAADVARVVNTALHEQPMRTMDVDRDLRWDNTAGEVHLAVRNLKIVVRRGTGGTWVSTWHLDGDLCKVFVPDPPKPARR